VLLSSGCSRASASPSSRRCATARLHFPKVWCLAAAYQGANSITAPLSLSLSLSLSVVCLYHRLGELGVGFLGSGLCLGKRVCGVGYADWQRKQCASMLLRAQWPCAHTRLVSYCHCCSGGPRKKQLVFNSKLRGLCMDLDLPNSPFSKPDYGHGFRPQSSLVRIFGSCVLRSQFSLPSASCRCSRAEAPPSISTSICTSFGRKHLLRRRPVLASSEIWCSFGRKMA
jgi:hypothetical protein